MQLILYREMGFRNSWIQMAKEWKIKCHWGSLCFVFSFIGFISRRFSTNDDENSHQQGLMNHVYHELQPDLSNYRSSLASRGTKLVSQRNFPHRWPSQPTWVLHAFQRCKTVSVSLEKFPAATLGRVTNKFTKNSVCSWKLFRILKSSAHLPAFSLLAEAQKHCPPTLSVALWTS